MKKRILSVFLCFCMALTLLPVMSVSADSVSYTDYVITSHDLEHVEEVLADVADVTEDGENIVITLTSDIYGRLHLGNNHTAGFEGDFVLDLNDKTVDAANYYGESICLDNDFEGTLTIIGSGTITSGYNNIIYIGSADVVFAIEDGYDYFTLQKDGEDYFPYEVCVEAELFSSIIRGDELVLTTGNFTSNVYTVTFDSNGNGTTPEGLINVAEGSLITMPEEPTGSDLDFVGWYKDAECSRKWDFEKDRVMRDTTLYALWTRNGTAFVPYGYVTDENGLMAYRAYNRYFDIIGYFANEWKSTAYGSAYYTYVKTEDLVRDVYVASAEEGGHDVYDTGINVAIDFNFMNNSETLQIVYTVKNISDTTKTYSIGSGADVQIGYDDWAVVTPFDDNSGFKMVSAHDGDKNDEGEFAQFNFFGKGYVGVTDISDFWYGRYYSYSSEYQWSENQENAIFYGANESESGDFDSAASWHWADETLEAGESKVFSVLIGIGGVDSENAAESTNPSETYTITFDANGGTVDSETMDTDEDGMLASLPRPTRSGYSFKGWYTEATGGTKITTDTVFDADTTIYARWRRNSSGGGNATIYKVEFKTNGGTSIEDALVLKNSKLKEPTTPVKSGYEFGGWYTDQNLTNAYDFDEKVTEGFTLYAKWIEDEAVGHDCFSEGYTDVSSSAWYHEDIDYVLEKGIMDGIADGVFAPNNKLTRAMLVTVLYRMEGKPATNRSIPFSDIDMGSWYASAVIWAKQNGIVNGITETEFAPDNNITREQVATIMLRYAQYKGLEALTLEDNLHFDDASDISEYAVSAMNWAVGTGLLKGKSETTINPNDYVTRAEIAAILHRYIEK